MLVRGNLKAAGLRNGDLVEVAGFREDGAVALKDGRCLPPWFRQFAHGYATTSHAAQGKTVDRGILLMADSGIEAGNLKQAYVSNSRFRESQMIFTSSKWASVASFFLSRIDVLLDPMIEKMPDPADRKLALEMASRAVPDEEAPRAAPRPTLRPRIAITVGG